MTSSRGDMTSARRDRKGIGFNSACEHEDSMYRCENAPGDGLYPFFAAWALTKRVQYNPRLKPRKKTQKLCRIQARRGGTASCTLWAGRGATLSARGFAAIRSAPGCAGSRLRLGGPLVPFRALVLGVGRLASHEAKKAAVLEKRTT